jgi:hypothetical protein
VKTRRITRTRQVPHTIGGITHPVDEEYTVEIPVPPRDWDHIILTAVTALAGILVLVAVVWSTANIGALLSRATIAPAAYAAAIAFDLAWIMCMAVEWLARYDRRRASMPRRAGHIALAIAMLAVAAHGWLDGERAIGLIGAAVSGLVKGLWTVVLSYYAAPLDPRTQAWVEQQLAEAGAQQALIPVQRQLLRSEGAVKAERHALAAAERKSAELEDALDYANGTVYRVVRAHLQQRHEVQAKPKNAQPPSEPAGPAGQAIEDVHSLIGQAHAPIVYFIRNGSRVKIGTTQNLKRRLAALTLRPDDVVRAEHGDQRHERALHARFADQRTGNTEWFDLAGPLAEYLGIALDAAGDAGAASGDAQEDAGDAGDDAETEGEPHPALPPLPAGASKTALILAASSTLQPDASAADIAHLLAQHGHAVDTAYVRTVLSRNSKPEDGIGKGGGGYA